MLERHVPALVGVSAASSAASASASTASASSTSIPVGRDRIGLSAPLVVALDGWAISRRRVSFPTVSTVGSTLGARMGCILGAFRVMVTISPMTEVLVGSMVGRPFSSLLNAIDLSFFTISLISRCRSFHVHLVSRNAQGTLVGTFLIPCVV